MDRRSFLIRAAGTAAAFGGGLGAAAAACAQAAPRGAGLDRIGLQLYTVRSLLGKDFDGTLGRVAEIGYEEVEFAGYHDRAPGAIRRLLDDLGLAAPSAHVGLQALDPDPGAAIDAAGTLGHRYLVVPWLAPEQRRTLDDYRRVADALNRAGEKASAAGVRVAYHNHEFEFEPIDGRIPYDVLLERTDPALVSHELDLFWITRGRQDPLAYFARHPGRFRLVHVKDMAGLPDGDMVDVGSGGIDFAAIFARREQAGIEHFFVEHDQPADPLASIRASHAHLDALEF